MPDERAKMVLSICGVTVELDLPRGYPFLFKRLSVKVRDYISSEEPLIRLKIIPSPAGAVSFSPEVRGRVKAYFLRTCRKFPVLGDTLITESYIRDIFSCAGLEAGTVIDSAGGDPERLLLYSGPEEALVYDRETARGMLFMGENKMYFGDISCVFNALLMQLASFLARCGTFFLHGCVLSGKNKAYILIGPSGAGKSTACRLAKGYTVISDDILPVIPRKGKVSVYTVPFGQRNDIPGPGEIDIPLKAVFFVHKDRKTCISEEKRSAALSRMLKNHVHFAMFYNREETRGLFRSLSRFAQNVPFYNMRFEKNKKFLDLIEGLKL
jgi:hypothetical protein